MSGGRGSRPLRLDCDRLWTTLVTWVYRLRRTPRVTNFPPPIKRR